jgi:hypothetical protein
MPCPWGHGRSREDFDDFRGIDYGQMMKSYFIRIRPHHFDYRYQNKIIFLTVCTFRKNSNLATHEYQKTLYNLWKNSPSWLVGHYLLMPDHLHLFVKSKGNSGVTLGSWIRYWKRAFSKIHNYTEMNPFWQKDYWDSNITHPVAYAQKWIYVQKNPLRKNLVLGEEKWIFQGTIHPLSCD